MKIVQIGTGGWGKIHTRILSPIFRIASRVIPFSADEEIGGVISWFRFTTNMFSPGASLTFPLMSNRIASSNPFFFASCVAIIELR